MSHEIAPGQAAEELGGRSVYLSPIRLLKRIKNWRAETIEAWNEAVAFRPLNDRGGPLSFYEGPTGPTYELAKIADNHSRGLPPGKDLPPDPLNRGR